jgi:predicted dehydrogenase
MVIADKRILIVGCGSIGKRHSRILHQLGIKSIALCDTDQRRIAEIEQEIQPLERYLSFHDALEHPFDAVFICTPPKLHVEQAFQALRNGCDLFIEKPLSITMDKLADLEKERSLSGRQVMVGLCFRYHQGVQTVKSILDSGKYGRLLSVKASIGEYLADCRPGVDYRELFVTDKDIGVTLDLCHETDFVQWIAQSRAAKIMAFTGKISDLDMEGDDLAEMIMVLDNQVVVSIHLDFFQRARRRISEYYCTNGSIFMDMTDWNLCKIRAYSAVTDHWEDIQIPMSRDNMFRDMDRSFLDCIQTRQPPSIDLDDGIHLIRVMLAAKSSSNQGKIVYL